MTNARPAQLLAQGMVLAVAAIALDACVPAISGQQRDAPRVGAATGGPTEQVSPGHGSLRQNQFTVELRSGALRIKVTPLAEEVIRLAAPDTYQRLHRLAELWGPRARQEAGDPEAELFLVSFFSYQPEVDYEPENLQLTHRGRHLAPRAIVSLTGGWGRERLRQQETQNAVYAFAGTIDYAQAFVVRYGLDRSDGWLQVIPVLERERSRVRSMERGPPGR